MQSQLTQQNLIWSNKMRQNRKPKRALISTDTGHKSSPSSRVRAGLQGPPGLGEDQDCTSASHRCYITEPRRSRWPHHRLINFSTKSNSDMRAWLGEEKQVILQAITWKDDKHWTTFRAENTGTQWVKTLETGSSAAACVYNREPPLGFTSFNLSA